MILSHGISCSFSFKLSPQDFLQRSEPKQNDSTKLCQQDLDFQSLARLLHIPLKFLLQNEKKPVELIPRDPFTNRMSGKGKYMKITVGKDWIPGTLNNHL